MYSRRHRSRYRRRRVPVQIAGLIDQVDRGGMRMRGKHIADQGAKHGADQRADARHDSQTTPNTPVSAALMPIALPTAPQSSADRILMGLAGASSCPRWSRASRRCCSRHGWPRRPKLTPAIGASKEKPLRQHARGDLDRRRRPVTPPTLALNNFRVEAGQV